MNLALHAHALFTAVQPPARGIRKEDLEAHMRRQYLGRAYQCAQCSFGPIDHFACGDLAFHNGQHVGSAVINNPARDAGGSRGCSPLGRSGMAPCRWRP
jgi:hypothetical protein